MIDFLLGFLVGSGGDDKRTSKAPIGRMGIALILLGLLTYFVFFDL